MPSWDATDTSILWVSGESTGKTALGVTSPVPSPIVTVSSGTGTEDGTSNVAALPVLSGTNLPNYHTYDILTISTATVPTHGYIRVTKGPPGPFSWGTISYDMTCEEASNNLGFGYSWPFAGTESDKLTDGKPLQLQLHEPTPEGYPLVVVDPNNPIDAAVSHTLTAGVRKVAAEPGQEYVDGNGLLWTLDGNNVWRPITPSIVFVNENPFTTYLGPLVFDMTPTTGGLFAWDIGGSYTQIGAAI